MLITNNWSREKADFGGAGKAGDEMLELIKRAYHRAVMLGMHPTKISMTQEMYDMLEVEAAQRFYARSKPVKDYTEVFGMQIEVRNDLDNGVMFHIS